MSGNSDNRLNSAASPYLRQHRHNPVNWRQWGKEALAEAHALDRPILLSIGYAACHWCHVMAHESFEDDNTAQIMNRLFVNIKVDREERPDLDKIYMSALNMFGEPGGWPLTMFLSPDGRPFWGGTYFPKTRQFGRPAFKEILNGVARAYKERRSEIETNCDAVTKVLQLRPRSEGGSPPPNVAYQAAAALSSHIDRRNGGFNGAPKFPQSAAMELLWRAGIAQGAKTLQNDVIHALTQMCRGGIYDHIGGGLSRYSVDERWLVPHFEKMLYDNAHLIALATKVNAHANLPMLEHRIAETIEWLDREIWIEGQGFAASLDADSEGVEGKFYLFSAREIAEILDIAAAREFSAAYGISEVGNFEGKNILNYLERAAAPAAPPSPTVPRGGNAGKGDDDRQICTDLPLEAASLACMREKLIKARDKRVRPARDDKILTDWNGLTIAALADAAIYARREDWAIRAQTAYNILMAPLHSANGPLAHSALGQERLYPALASDYGAMMRAALHLTQSVTDPAAILSYIDDARNIAAIIEADYLCAEGGYYLSSRKADDLIVRHFSIDDDAQANHNALICDGLVKLSSLSGNIEFAERASRVFDSLGDRLWKNPIGSAGLLNAFDQGARGALVTIILPDEPAEPNDQSHYLHAWQRARELSRKVDALGDPAILRLIIAGGGDGLPFDAAHPLHGKCALGNLPTLYWCTQTGCSAPITSESELAEYIEKHRV